MSVFLEVIKVPRTTRQECLRLLNSAWRNISNAQVQINSVYIIAVQSGHHDLAQALDTAIKALQDVLDLITNVYFKIKGEPKT